MDEKKLLRDILPVLLGPVTIYEEHHDKADGWFKDLYKGYTREIPEALRNRRVCIVRGRGYGEEGLDIQLEREETT